VTPRTHDPHLREGPAAPSRLDDGGLVELRGGNAVAARNDFAARDFRSVGNHGAEVLIVDPLRRELSGLLGLLGGLEETERTQNAVAGLDQVVAAKPGELAKLRNERLVDLADDLVRAGRVDAFATTNGGFACVAPYRGLTGQNARTSELRRSGQRSQSERKVQSLGGFNSQSQRANRGIAAILFRRRNPRTRSFLAAPFCGRSVELFSLCVHVDRSGNERSVLPSPSRACDTQPVSASPWVNDLQAAIRDYSRTRRKTPVVRVTLVTGESHYVVVRPLSAGRTPSTATPGQDVKGQERDDDDRRRNSDDRDGGGSEEHRADHIQALSG
jgi:hypothetical protein